MSKHEPLHEKDAQERAEERGERIPVTLADLSPLECEALAFYRLHPRNLKIFADEFGTTELKQCLAETRRRLLVKKLISVVDNQLHFDALTHDGARLQAELFAEDDHAN